MKVTKSYIKQLVKEELSRVLETYEMPYPSKAKSNPVTWEELESMIKSKVPEAEFGKEYTIKIGGQVAYQFDNEGYYNYKPGTYFPKRLSPKYKEAHEQVYNILSTMHLSRGIEIMPGREIKILKPVQNAYEYRSPIKEPQADMVLNYPRKPQ
tara:strand:- start:647 stop:1105 length:459 start_codon:yes stop_codon:yes gene_type:complete